MSNTETDIFDQLAPLTGYTSEHLATMDVDDLLDAVVELFVDAMRARGNDRDKIRGLVQRLRGVRPAIDNPPMAANDELVRRGVLKNTQPVVVFSGFPPNLW